MTTTTTPQNTISTTTTYRGTEHRYLNGHLVRVIAVIKGAAAPDYDADACTAYLTDEDDIARAGGVTAADRVEVQPWIEKEGRFSFASSDARAIDLACFAHLAC